MVDGEHPTRSAITGADQPARYRATGSSPSPPTTLAPGGRRSTPAAISQPCTVRRLNPIAHRQIPQAQAAVPVEVSELRGRRADTVAGSPGAPGNAPTLETEIHQVGATAQPIGNLRRRVTPRVQATICTSGTSARTVAGLGRRAHRRRPPSCAPSGPPPPLLRHRRNRQPLVDIQPPQSRSSRSRSRPNHRQRVCPPLNHPTRRPWVAIARGRGFGTPRPPPPQPSHAAPRPDRVGRCNPVHRSPVTWRLGEAERPSGPWFCAYYSGRGSGTWVRRCVSRPWLGDVRGWDDALWDARPRLLLPATAKMLRIDTLVARNHIRSPGRLLACWIQDTS